MAIFENDQVFKDLLLEWLSLIGTIAYAAIIILWWTYEPRVFWLAIVCIPLLLTLGIFLNPLVHRTIVWLYRLVIKAFQLISGK